MSDFAHDIELMLGAAPPVCDASGILSTIHSRFAARGCTAVYLAELAGTVRACDPPGAAQACAAIELELAAQRVSPANAVDGIERHSWGAQRVLTRELPLPDGRRGHVALLFEDAADEVTAQDVSAELVALAVAAWRANESHEAIQSSRARIEHLESELWTLKQAHAETVTWLLNEREEHLQAKRRHILQLECEVEKRSAALRDALKKAEAANQAKSDFLANVSHEVRTPMTSILGFSESLMTEKLSPTEQVEALQTIRRNGQHLLEIINDILDLSKIEAGKLETTAIACSPGREVAEVVALMRQRAAEKKLALEAEFVGGIPETVNTDPIRLRQILINLIGNAIKFTASGSVRVVVRMQDVKTEGQEGSGLRFDVIDSGIGITPEQMARLFRPFGQADSSVTRRFGGTGLGLTISKRLASMLGGDVTCTSSPGHGSTFSLTIRPSGLSSARLIADATLATFQNAATEPAPSAVIGVRLDGMRVLLAEDGPDNQRLLTAILKKVGAQVAIVDNGRLAVEAIDESTARGEPFSVVLMDMQMPEMDGYTAAATLRSKGCSVPIIALTAHAMSGDREKCLSAGCNEYLTKPIDRKRLLDVVATLGTATAAAR